MGCVLSEKQVLKCYICLSPVSKISSDNDKDLFRYICPNHDVTTPVYVDAVPAQNSPVSEQIHSSYCCQGSKCNPWLNLVLSKIAIIHDKKNHDYTPPGDDPFFNFRYSSEYAEVHAGGELSPFESFNILLGTKLARLYALMKRQEMPNHESITDTEWDFVIYFLLREAYKLKMGEK